MPPESGVGFGGRTIDAFVESVAAALELAPVLSADARSVHLEGKTLPAVAIAAAPPTVELPPPYLQGKYAEVALAPDLGSLRQDERVISMERTHAARLDPASEDPLQLPERAGLVVADVSFISLTRLLHGVASHVGVSGDVEGLLGGLARVVAPPTARLVGIRGTEDDQLVGHNRPG